MPAGDSNALSIRAPSGNAAPLPIVWRDPFFFSRIQLSDVGLVVANEQDRFAVGRPASLGAFANRPLIRAVAVHHPDFRKSAAERRIHDPLAVGAEARIGIGIRILGELLRILAAGVHGPYF